VTSPSLKVKVKTARAKVARDGEMAGKQQQQHRSYRRLNGCSWPPHPFQVSAWVVLMYFTFIHFSTVSPQFVIAWQPASYLVSLTLLLYAYLYEYLRRIIY
jgi:hypothetical protein